MAVRQLGVVGVITGVSEVVGIRIRVVIRE